MLNRKASLTRSGFLRFCIHMKSPFKNFLSPIVLTIAIYQGAVAQMPTWKTVGVMRNVMMKGDLTSMINLDTLRKQTNLYGLGPGENLTSELVVLNGKSYQSFVQNNKASLTETYKTKAPFFVYGYVPRWREQSIPPSVTSLTELESYLNSLNLESPFFFQINGAFDQLSFHIVNVPRGTVIDGPDKVKVGQVNITESKKEFQVLGFYSRQHKGVITHHDTNLHLHALSVERKQMGHLDDAKFSAKAVKLLLPAQ